MKKKLEFKNFGATIALIILVVVIGTISPQFRTVNNIFSLLRQSSVNGLIAFGMTFVILTGGIDLSVGAVLALSTVFAASMISVGVPVPVAVIISLIIGTVLGLISGFLVSKGRLQPFIATLVTMTIYRGITMIYTNGKPISNLGNSEFLRFIGRGELLGIPVPVWILLVTFLIFFFLLKKTVLGRKIYAVGSNQKAAAIAGVNINKIKLFVYSVSGFMSALAGIILLSRLGSAQPVLGIGYELDAIAAVALGGTSLSGGRGRFYGTLIGVLIIAVLNNGLNILGVSSYYQDVAKGIVILIAVLSDKER